MSALIDTEIDRITPQLIALRHELHQMPEVGLELPNTARRIRSEIDSLGLEVVAAKSSTGYMAILRGGAAGEDRPLVLLRADMDGLPVKEATKLPWASKNGNMHACGHDLHMAGLVGAMRALHHVREHLAGDVLFMFQPGEEAHHGGDKMIAEGLLEAAGRTPDHAYACHVWAARYPAKAIFSRPTGAMASSDNLYVTIKGRGGHGSAPHETHDPIMACAQILSEIQVTVAREFDAFDPVVVTCGQIHAGSSENIIPGEAKMDFTMRSVNPQTRIRLQARIQELIHSLAQANNVEAKCVLDQITPVTFNDAAEYQFVANTLAVKFKERWMPQSHAMAASEDFAYVLEKIPGCFIGVSAVPEGTDENKAQFNHSAKANFADYAVADTAKVLAELAWSRLGTAKEA